MKKREKVRAASHHPEKEQSKGVLNKHSYLLIILVLFISIFLHFREVIISDKTFLSPDFLAPQSFATFIEDARKTGDFPLWNPYIFCGMPSYGSLMILGDRTFDLTSLIFEKLVSVLKYAFLNAEFAWAFVYYLIMGIGVYLFVFYKVKENLPALIAALATVFSMYIIIWISVGHGTKILVMAFFPYIFYFIENLRERWSLLHALLLTVTVHFAFIGSHIQMIFYIFLAIGIYFLYFLAHDIFTRSNAWKGIVRAGVILAVATGLAFAMISDKYLSVLEYTPYSIRGADPITANPQDPTSSGSRGGLDYEYATNWSFSPGEIMTFFVPSWYGFGWHTYEGPLTNQQPVRINTYFGPMPFTDAPNYMGIVVLVLAIVGFIRNRKDPFVQFSAILIAVSLLLSFGRELSLFYDLMFYYFPYFNKFRAPSMILVLVQFMVPILAAYGVSSLLRDKEKILSPGRMKNWKLALGVLTALLAVSLVGKGLLTEVYGLFFPLQETTRTLATKYGNMQVAAELYKFIANTVAIDILFALLFLLATFGAFFLYFKKKITVTILSAVIVIAVIADLWRINTKPIETHERREQEQVFSEPEHVKFLHKDKSLFRVLELENGQPPTSNLLAYWRIQSAHGYHAAKIRSYQDMVDVVGFGNPLLWQLMNIKYIISNQEITHPFLKVVYDAQSHKVYENSSVLPRAFFVNRYEVTNGMDILKKMADVSFDPRDLLFLMNTPEVTVEPAMPGAEVSFLEYNFQDFKVEVRATGNNLLFLSEVYYPKGWKAFLDGSEIPLYRANYLFRAVIIPPGKHVLEMRFEPEGFSIGKKISLGMNILLLGAFGFVGVRYVLKRKSAKKNL